MIRHVIHVTGVQTRNKESILFVRLGVYLGKCWSERGEVAIEEININAAVEIFRYPSNRHRALY